ncbi:MAG: DUF3040 domain-containing protein [Acidimicrobiia bacterium]|nr:DUF3040 domain-containing protein [Acidimicrobiia bacterium]
MRTVTVLGGDVTNDEVSRAVQNLEHDLEDQDPAFVRGFEKLGRLETATLVLVIVLLAACVVLLAGGLATQSAGLWCLAMLAFAGAFAADHRCKRSLTGRAGPRAGPSPRA